MNTLFTGQHTVRLPEVDSTNNFATNYLSVSKVPEGTAIMADHQTQGKGQMGATWSSEPGKNLMVSYVYYPIFLESSNHFLLSKAAALAACEAINALLPNHQVQVKWPNDILVNGKKIAGILIENSFRSNHLKHAVIGIGINVNQTEFPGLSHVTSLQICSKHTWNKEEVFIRLSEWMEKYYLLLRAGKYKDVKKDYMNQLYGMEKPIEVQYRNKQGMLQIRDVMDDGTLKGLFDEYPIEANLKSLRFIL